MRIEIISPQDFTSKTADKVYRFRYENFVVGAHMPDSYADHDRHMLYDPLDAMGHQVIAFDTDNKVIGVVRINTVAAGLSDDIVALHQLSELDPRFATRCAISSRLVVDPAYRNTTMPANLAVGGLKVMRRHGCSWCVICCDPQNVPFFNKLGFERFVDEIQHPDFGASALMKYNVASPPVDGKKIARYIAKQAIAEEMPGTQNDDQSAVSA